MAPRCSISNGKAAKSAAESFPVGFELPPFAAARISEADFFWDESAFGDEVLAVGADLAFVGFSGFGSGSVTILRCEGSMSYQAMLLN